MSETPQPPTLAGRYRLERLIGSGGAADVHRATDLVLDRAVAVKVLRAGTTALEDDTTARARFDSEARLLARLSDPGLVAVLDAGTDETGGDRRPFLVLELVEGGSLSDLVARGPLDPEAVARIGSSVAGGLAACHTADVVHRDVKPANVLIDRAGHAKLTDLGIARLLDNTDGHTRTGTTIGTAAYLAPEQARGDHVTPAADVYSLGLVLLEALTATRAFPGTPAESAIARLSRDPVVPDDLPDGWAPLLREATSADPAARPTAADLAGRLASLAADPTGPAPTAVLAAEDATAVLDDQGARGRGAGALGAGALGAGALGAGALGGAALGGAAAATAPTYGAPTSAAPAAAGDAGDAATTQVAPTPAATGTTAGERQDRRRRPGAVPFALGGVALAVLLAVGAAAVLGGGSDESPAGATTSESTSRSSDSSDPASEVASTTSTPEPSETLDDKEAEKASREAEKEAEKASREAEKEAEKAAKEAEKEAREAAKD
ncbi:serine/threonine-protein kinase [Nocardioides bruguierae]|uniref:non-specific serine/threonine protein kinase n=1 Tax=Nocardioides bruguierae TaxID=2945102 RepID=A0A9X2IGS6_9ACTN|nr:serine/threonine-protein kinase [Nocardioides bruguierae]MCM0622328.1 serine/threonine protein kinase [Nocardioides bruguierae]